MDVHCHHTCHPLWVLWSLLFHYLSTQNSKIRSAPKSWADDNWSIKVPCWHSKYYVGDRAKWTVRKNLICACDWRVRAHRSPRWIHKNQISYGFPRCSTKPICTARIAEFALNLYRTQATSRHFYIDSCVRLFDLCSYTSWNDPLSSNLVMILTKFTRV